MGNKSIFLWLEKGSRSLLLLLKKEIRTKRKAEFEMISSKYLKILKKTEWFAEEGLMDKKRSYNSQNWWKESAGREVDGGALKNNCLIAHFIKISIARMKIIISYHSLYIELINLWLIVSKSLSYKLLFS